MQHCRAGARKRGQPVPDIGGGPGDRRGGRPADHVGVPSLQKGHPRSRWGSPGARPTTSLQGDGETERSLPPPKRPARTEGCLHSKSCLSVPAVHRIERRPRSRAGLRVRWTSAGPPRSTARSELRTHLGASVSVPQAHAACESKLDESQQPGTAEQRPALSNRAITSWTTASRPSMADSRRTHVVLSGRERLTRECRARRRCRARSRANVHRHCVQGGQVTSMTALVTGCSSGIGRATATNSPSGDTT